MLVHAKLFPIQLAQVCTHPSLPIMIQCIILDHFCNVYGVQALIRIPHAHIHSYTHTYVCIYIHSKERVQYLASNLTLKSNENKQLRIEV